MGCVVTADFYAKYLAITLTPIAVLLLVFFFFLLPQYISALHTHDDYVRALRLCQSVAFDLFFRI